MPTQPSSHLTAEGIKAPGCEVTCPRAPRVVLGPDPGLKPRLVYCLPSRVLKLPPRCSGLGEGWGWGRVSLSPAATTATCHTSACLHVLSSRRSLQLVTCSHAAADLAGPWVPGHEGSCPSCEYLRFSRLHVAERAGVLCPFTSSAPHFAG